MRLELSEEVADELRETLTVVVGDMSSEIADTDNPQFRAGLQDRRSRLRSVLAQFEGAESPRSPA